MLNLNLTADKPVATIKGDYKADPQNQLVVDYKGKLQAWDKSWLAELEEQGQIVEVKDSKGMQFTFEGTGPGSREVSEADIA